MDEEFLRDLFRSLPQIGIRRMFGGQGIYSEGRIVALVIGGTLHLKSDPESEAVYAEAGLDRWTYTRPGRAAVKMPYWRFPEDAYDDPDEADRWIAIADAASRRVARQAPEKPPRKAKSRSTGR
ncbi:TfoX/Sxy family protein [Jiella pacifica]|uniref:Competence protein TfoX n=1 Tax=Jiella pacifica TaxID=2696469 RepID=A0A6N9T5G2_9HYPH|nr:TfoX/Sxy family protein [Jiella pacifica]NDW05306.1 competence protein TfoX [Jiella pacifica]